jgi:hypothetical protein
MLGKSVLQIEYHIFEWILYFFEKLYFMPPKKADPEAQKKEWEVYRESEEWKKL